MLLGGRWLETTWRSCVSVGMSLVRGSGAEGQVVYSRGFIDLGLDAPIERVRSRSANSGAIA